MIDWVAPDRYLAFLAVMTVFAFTPGPANVFAIATGLGRGRVAALLGVLGMNMATLVWYIAAALGLGALVIAYPQAFALLAIAGGLYVGWLGLQSLIKAWRGVDALAITPRSGARSAVLDGFLVQIANPKAILFFTAVLPPFLDPARPMPPQFALFGAGTLTLDIIAMSAYGLGGALLAERVASAGFRRGFSAVVGVLLLLAAVLILLRLR